MGDFRSSNEIIVLIDFVVMALGLAEEPSYLMNSFAMLLDFDSGK